MQEIRELRTRPYVALVGIYFVRPILDVLNREGGTRLCWCLVRISSRDLSDTRLLTTWEGVEQTDSISVLSRVS
jgi:hypothetical protein